MQYIVCIQNPFWYLLPSGVLRMDKQYTVKKLITYFCLYYTFLVRVAGQGESTMFSQTMIKMFSLFEFR